MSEDKKVKKEELTQCDECCSKELKRVHDKGEVWCLDCVLLDIAILI